MTEMKDGQGKLYLDSPHLRKGVFSYLDRDRKQWKMARHGVIVACERCGNPANTDPAYVYLDDPERVRCDDCVISSKGVNQS